MNTRKIIRHPDVLDGRWHFDGTTIAVASVRLDHANGGAEHDGSYRFMDLTEDEIGSALAFTFPAIRESSMDTLYASVVMHCECGEDTSQAMTWPTESHLQCQCGRTWLVEVTFRLLVQSHQDAAD
jgi:uncharacterized protein (DUF433 family)